MTLLFNRAARLTVGVPGDIGIVFEGLRFTFDITKSSESNPNTAKISVYNPSQTTRQALEKEGLVMLFEAGYVSYGGEQPLIETLFSGDVKKFIVNRKGPDVIATFEGGDGETKLTESKINKSYESGTLGLQVLRDLASGLGLSLNAEVLASLPTIVFQHGLTLSGNVKEKLDEFTKKAGLEWSVQDGELKILDPDLPTLETSVVVTANTGLLGEPMGREEGIEFKSLLNPKIRPGRLVSIASSKVIGLYKVRKAKYKGDTHGGTYEVTAEAKEFSG